MVFARRTLLCLAASFVCAAVVQAQDMPGAVLELTFTPAPRAQFAIWLEDAQGRFLRTLSLTESVAFHGLGNRPGASQMNSGYRWPYGRREGVLPIWATRRAAAPGAKRWKRVIFQDRTSEGLASRTSNDQSPDAYFCLSFNQGTTGRSALDAVSCASPFSSDKGRFITTTDVSAGYHEPFEDPVSHVGRDAPLPPLSLYPPRMDATRCSASGSCFDHADVASYVAQARAVMPEIDAVTLATPPGGVQQSLLFSLPPTWPKGSYVLFFEINVEGDYNVTYDATTFATPTKPAMAWDSWATGYGYPYRGQPSVAFEVPFELAEVGEATEVSKQPTGRSSWDFWSSGYGELQPVSDIADDPAGAPGSGADRLRRDAAGQRLSLHVRTLMTLPEPDPSSLPQSDPAPGMQSGGGAQAGTDPQPSSSSPSASAPASASTSSTPSSAQPAMPPQMQRDPQGDAVILVPEQGVDGPVGAIRKLHLGRHPDPLHSDRWIAISFLTPDSDEPLHGYDVRVSGDPIVDENTFILNGRPAKTASEDEEGAVSLKLSVGAPAGSRVSGDIGDLNALTHYYVAVRATDSLNRHGPISVAQITTTKRTFATVTPCFVATAVYGTPLAEQVGVLRRLRDRHLMSNTAGRTLVRAYYAAGGRLARGLRAHPLLRGAVRAMLDPVVAIARKLEARE